MIKSSTTERGLELLGQLEGLLRSEPEPNTQALRHTEKIRREIGSGNLHKGALGARYLNQEATALRRRDRVDDIERSTAIHRLVTEVREWQDQVSHETMLLVHGGTSR